MKFTKFIPAVFALMLAAPAFAAPVASLNDTMSFDIDPFFTITRNGGTVLSATASVNDTYTNLTLTAMNVNYHVITNSRTDVVYVHAECPIENSGTAQALYGTADASTLNLVFSNSEAAPASTSVTNITGGSAAAKDNPNAIAVQLTPAITTVANSGATTPVGVLADGVVTYTITNGEYDFKYTTKLANLANTFSTLDTEGLYTSTVYISHTNP